VDGKQQRIAITPDAKVQSLIEKLAAPIEEDKRILWQDGKKLSHLNGASKSVALAKEWLCHTVRRRLYCMACCAVASAEASTPGGT